MTSHQIVEASRLWLDGYDTYDISHMMGIHESEVWNHLYIIKGKDEQRPRRPRGRVSLRLVS